MTAHRTKSVQHELDEDRQRRIRAAEALKKHPSLRNLDIVYRTGNASMRVKTDPAPGR